MECGVSLPSFVTELVYFMYLSLSLYLRIFRRQFRTFIPLGTDALVSTNFANPVEKAVHPSTFILLGDRRRGGGARWGSQWSQGGHAVRVPYLHTFDLWPVGCTFILLWLKVRTFIPLTFGQWGGPSYFWG